MTIKRPIYDYNSYKDVYDVHDINKTSTLRHFQSYVKNKLHKIQHKSFASYLPVFNLIRTYQFRENFFRDLVGGITVGVIQIAPSKNIFFVTVLYILFQSDS